MTDRLHQLGHRPRLLHAVKLHPAAQAVLLQLAPLMARLLAHCRLLLYLAGLLVALQPRRSSLESSHWQWSDGWPCVKLVLLLQSVFKRVPHDTVQQ